MNNLLLNLFNVQQSKDPIYYILKTSVNTIITNFKMILNTYI